MVMLAFQNKLLVSFSSDVAATEKHFQSRLPADAGPLFNKMSASASQNVLSHFDKRGNEMKGEVPECRERVL